MLLLLEVLVGCGGDAREGDPEAGPPMAFQGSSDGLERTVIVPTLDTPMPSGKNVIWCASFQVAWNKLKDDLCKGPVKLDRAQETADRLNRASATEADLLEDSYYAAAGFVKDGILQTIESEMQKRFGKSPRIQVAPKSSGGCTAYAYLQARVKFDIPFFENREPFEFQESGGESVPVSSFGLRAQDDYAYDNLRGQVEVLQCRQGAQGNEQEEFVIDPCRTSSPNQLVLAYVRPKATLAETIQDVRDKIKSFSTGMDRESFEFFRTFETSERLLVPNVNFEIDHEFRELRGANFENTAMAGYSVEAALQNIQFRLDRSGAELESEAAMPCAAIPRYFFVKGPFLVYLQRRDTQRPFFAVWVDNAELLCKP
jgi:hypothetical protein